jgi:alanine racemase
MSAEAMRAVAHVDLAAVAGNCARLRGALANGSTLCAVVKADGYGHGAAQTARAAIAGGAVYLAVAAADEARELREAGLTDVPVLVMGALTREELAVALAAGAEVVVWREDDVERIAAAGGGRVHVKLDTGMGRLGTRDAQEASRVVERAARTAGVELVGVMTHFATADDLEDGGFFDGQLEAFQSFLAHVRSSHPGVIAHAANSAALLRSRESHFDMVRCGIAVYGMDPFGADPLARGLSPALGLRSYVATVKRCRAGQSTGYGRRFVAERDTWLGVLPLGYGDGFRRGLSNNSEALVAGRRFPEVGTVSMDNVVIDLGPDAASERLLGEEAVLIGEQGQERITAEELAARLDTINYEITCGITARVPRLYSDVPGVGV